MKKVNLLFGLTALSITCFAQNTGIGTTTPQSRFHVNGTAWFQGNNTPLPSNASAGIGIGYSTGATGGYIFAFNYTSFTPRDLWLNSTGGSVLVNSQSASPQARLHVEGAGWRAVYANTNANEAVYGYSSGSNAITGVSAVNLGVYAVSQAESAGLIAEGRYIGAQGTTTGTNPNRQAIRGEVNGGGYAGLFQGGTTWVVGTLQKNAGAFLIDDPLEPETKFLYHSFVESPDMKDIYDGVVTTDGNGMATVAMPAWFQALNIEYRYQLTCMGQFAVAIIQEEISGNQFVIKTDKPNVKVSWQVTGIRNDPYARDKRIPVEKLKTANEIGKYIYPEGYGKGPDYLLDILKPTNFGNTASTVASH